MATIAYKTLLKIDQLLESDQGALFRKHLGDLVRELDDVYSQDQFPFRKHLGASVIGKKCKRELWYNFRWSKIINHTGRIIRLFNRGHLEEARFLALLKMIGIDVYYKTDDGGQYRISDFNGHFSGSCDGVGVNIPDLDPSVPCLLEFKTSAQKAFLAIKSKGVHVEKYEHYVQMQVYMYKLGLNFALYMVVNKNTDEIHAEIISLDPELAESKIDTANQIITTDRPPKGISTKPSWYECKFCDYHGICHDNETPHQNCRTCKNSYPNNKGNWSCAKLNLDLNKQDQFTKSLECGQYERLF